MLLSVAALLTAMPGGAAAEGPAAEVPTQEGADRWVPSLSVISGITIQSWDGGVSSRICRGCTFPNPASVQLRPTVSGNDLDVTPYVGGSLELMTPELPIRTSPRLFLGGEIAASFGVDRRVANEGDPGTIGSPFPPGNPTLQWSEDQAVGQGSVTSATRESPFYGAYAGIAFPFGFKGRQLRVRPGFAWMYYEVGITGKVSDAECLSNNRCNPNGTGGGFQRAIQLQGSAKESFNAIGPAIDLEMDTGRFGPIGSSLFLGGRAYYILGNRDIVAEDTQSYNDVLGNDQVQATWNLEVDPWLYRVNVGIRFQWLGLGD